MKKRLVSILLFLVINLLGHTLFAQKELSIDDFLEMVKSNHPVAKQAYLLKNEAAAQGLAAQGGFDPKLVGDWQGKQFDDKRYFQTQEYGVKIPTWFGIELKGLYKTANGDFLNPEKKLPKIGQAVAGVSAPLLQGLLIDERRAALFRAQIVEKANDNERRIILNNLLLEATKAYFEWKFAAQQVEIQAKAVVLAETRLSGLRESFRVGDKPAVDTLESYIQVQERLFDLNDAKLLLQNEALQLSNFLWSEKQQPVQLLSTVYPSHLVINIDAMFTKTEINRLAQNHPDFLQYGFKIKQLELEKRLKKDKLKPKLNIEYNFLGNGTTFLADALLQNYKYGISFSFPILLRQERANLQLTEIKLNSTDLQRQNKQIELQNKLNGYLNELENSQKQFALFSAILKRYESLLDAENQKFNLGESSVFLVNARERKLIETQIKLLKLNITQQKLYYSLKWAAGEKL